MGDTETYTGKPFAPIELFKVTVILLIEEAVVRELKWGHRIKNSYSLNMPRCDPGDTHTLPLQLHVVNMLLTFIHVSIFAGSCLVIVAIVPNAFCSSQIIVGFQKVQVCFT